jgi:hypothetical protein
MEWQHLLYFSLKPLLLSLAVNEVLVGELLVINIGNLSQKYF